MQTTIGAINDLRHTHRSTRRRHSFDGRNDEHPGTNYTTILVLRELESHAVFTTNGQDADIASLSVVGDDSSIEYSPGLMFMRKQTGSDRRMGKAIQRELLKYDRPDSMEVNDMNPKSVESALYGSAASGDDDVDIGVTSRVMYDTAFTVRDASACIDEKFQNAPGEGMRKDHVQRSVSRTSSNLERCSRVQSPFEMRLRLKSRLSPLSRNETSATEPQQRDLAV